LIELLVVIAIIALLMSILMPALTRVRKQARAVVCQSNLKQWGTIWAMYTDENNGFFPKRRSASGRWIDVLFDYYYKDPKFRVCPAATKIAAPQYPPGASGTLEVGGDAETSWGRVAETGGPARGHLGQLRDQRLGSSVRRAGRRPLWQARPVLLEDPQRQRRIRGAAVSGLLVLVRLAGSNGHAAPIRRPPGTLSRRRQCHEPLLHQPPSAGNQRRFSRLPRRPNLAQGPLAATVVQSPAL
jgi:type II secretory pathway pseudopilin PulG